MITMWLTTTSSIRPGNLWVTLAVVGALTTAARSDEPAASLLQDGSAQIDEHALAALLEAWGGGGSPLYDFNRDGLVDENDLAALVLGFQQVAVRDVADGRVADMVAAPGGALEVQAALPRRRATPQLFGPDNRVTTPALDVAALLAEDATGGGGPLRMGRVQPLRAHSGEVGRWTQLEDGGWLWTRSFRGTGAQAIRLRIRPWRPPAGAELIVYAPGSPETVRGPLTASVRPPSGALWTPTVYGSEARLEYYLPPGIDHLAPRSQIIVDGLLNQYRALSSFGDTSLPCHLDIMCHPDWITAGRAGGAIAFVGANLPNGYFCSGALLNRTAGAVDFTPLFMTATHCGITETNADTVEVTWLYRTDSCDGTVPDPSTLDMTQGCTVLFQGGTSDWTLLGLTFDVPSGLAYLGWDADHLNNFTPVVGIHHPKDAPQKISFGVKIGNSGSRPDLDNPPSCEAGSAYVAMFGDPDNNGLIEPGSSGSPMIDTLLRVRGVLSCGGPFSCAAGNSGSYGRFDSAFDPPFAFSGMSAYLAPTDPIFVDVAAADIFEDGTVTTPFTRIKEGTYAVISGSDVFIESGAYNEQFAIAKPMTLHAVNGTVVIGQ